MQKHRRDIGQHTATLPMQDKAGGRCILHQEGPVIVAGNKSLREEDQAIDNNQQDRYYGKAGITIRFCIVQWKHKLDLELTNSSGKSP